jgi:murein DD-endopeptidase MepM/ murein hydrolase activator NlpD
LKKLKYPNIYLSLAVCLIAVAVGAVVSVTTKEPASDETSGFERVTVEWRTETTQPESENVNIGVSGIKDERLFETTTEKAEENKPYSGKFILPMGNDIIKDFSAGEMVYSETMGDWRVHNGVDFGGSAGNDVGAVADGKITKVYDDVFWGTVVEIDHGNGMTARYCGMKNATCLPEGTQVVKGEKIGTLGHIPVEISDEDHLHLEILIDGKTVDPLKAMNKIRNP